MLSTASRAHDDAFAAPPPLDAVPLDAPEDLVSRYIALTAQRRAVEDQLAFVRAELEMIASSMLKEHNPRGRFSSAAGAISVRLQPTCVFDRGEVTRALQRAGRLADVAAVSGPSLARFLAKEPVLAARLSDHIRYRNSVVLNAMSV
jgi:hypothetical protein